MSRIKRLRPYPALRVITSADSPDRMQGVHDGLGGECDREGAAPAEPLTVNRRNRQCAFMRRSLNDVRPSRE